MDNINKNCGQVIPEVKSGEVSEVISILLEETTLALKNFNDLRIKLSVVLRGSEPAETTIVGKRDYQTTIASDIEKARFNISLLVEEICTTSNLLEL